MKKPFFLNKPTKFHHNENRMKDEGNLVKARQFFYQSNHHNLKQLLAHRYNWMNKFILPKNIGIEIGAGTGISKEFIKNRNYKITDKANYEWLDIHNIDALETGFDDNAFDFIVSSNMIHHVPYPMAFFKEMSRILKPGGFLLIQEINASLMMRFLLNLMKHEGYSYDVDVFKENEICTNKDDLWDANCAIPNILFDDEEKFSQYLPFFEIKHRSFSECLTFINSGGVIAKTVYIPLPIFLIKIMTYIDKALCFFPKLFALQRQIALQNKKI